MRMRMRSFVVTSLLAVVSYLGSRPAQAETIEEAVQRQEKQAQIDRKLMSVYAVSVEVLRSGRPLPGMPAELVKCAREGCNDPKIGKSKVDVEFEGGFVTFSITARASSEPDWNGAVGMVTIHDPLRRNIGMLHGIHTRGMVFAKTKKTLSRVIPDPVSCSGVDLFSGTHEFDMGISVACTRFNLGRNTEDIKFLKTQQDIDSEHAFFTWLVSVYGKEGVLSRAVLDKALKGHLARLSKLVDDSKERTGYITYNRVGDTYIAASGRVMSASVHSLSGPKPGEAIEITVDVFSEKMVLGQIELFYEDGGEVMHTAFGNLAKALIAREDLIDSDDSPRAFQIVKIRLPKNLQPGKIKILASAVDGNGDQVAHNERIGEFEYAKADPEPSKK